MLDASAYINSEGYLLIVSETCSIAIVNFVPVDSIFLRLGIRPQRLSEPFYPRHNTVALRIFGLSLRDIYLIFIPWPEPPQPCPEVPDYPII